MTIFLLTYVLPKFTPLFNRRGIQLPRTTVFMMGLSDTLTEYWPYWLAGAVALVVGFIFGKRTEQGKQVWDWCKIHAPLSGRDAPQGDHQPQRSHAGHDGRQRRAGARRHPPMRRRGRQYLLRAALAESARPGDRRQANLRGARQIPLFPPMLVQMISTGEQTGKLDVVLERVSTYYDQEVESSLKTVTSMLEPIMITVMGVVVGGIAMSLLLPIFSLSRTPG